MDRKPDPIPVFVNKFDIYYRFPSVGVSINRIFVPRFIDNRKLRFKDKKA